MPCTKCEEGKYKWGKTGECKYDTLESCESANSKYNKMQPTPLGKKTYEEYAKELKEYNLSTQRFDFKDMKTLAKLLKEAAKLDSSFKKLKDKAIKSDIANDDATDLYIEADNAYENQKDVIVALRKKNNAAEEKAEGVQVKLLDKASKLEQKSDDAFNKFEKEHQIVMSMKGEIQSFLLNFRVAVTQVEKAGKELGVDIPVDKFKSAIDKLDSLQLTYKA